MMSSSVSDDVLEDVDLSQENFRRRVREVLDMLLLKIPTSVVEGSVGLEVVAVGATLQTTMESLSSSNVTSTRSC